MLPTPISNESTDSDISIKQTLLLRGERSRRSRRSNSFDSDNDSTEGELEGDAEVEELSSYKAFIGALSYSTPYILSRVLAVGRTVGNGVLTSNFDPSVVAGIALGSLYQQLFISIVKGGTTAIDTLISGSEGVEENKARIGALFNQGLVVASAIGIPTSVLFFTANSWLRALGTDPAVAGQAGRFLRGLSYGFLTSCFANADQNLLLSIGRPHAASFFHGLFVLSSVAIGYSMTLYTQDAAWLAYGMSIAATITFLLDRIYLYFSENNGVLDRVTYNLFSTSFDSGVSFWKLIKLSTPAALQGLNEWLPSLVTTLIVASNTSSLADRAQIPSVQFLVAFNQILLALSTITGILVAKELGKATGSENGNDIAVKNARVMGYAGVNLTNFFTLLPTLFGIVYPDPVVQLFIRDPESFELAKAMFRTTCATVLIDGVRNALTGALFGRNQSQDNFFSFLTNLTITVGFGSALGFITQKQLHDLSQFIGKMIGTFITTVFHLVYWEKQSKRLKSKPLLGNCCGIGMWQRETPADSLPGSRMGSIHDRSVFTIGNENNDEESQLNSNDGLRTLLGSPQEKEETVVWTYTSNDLNFLDSPIQGFKTGNIASSPVGSRDDDSSLLNRDINITRTVSDISDLTLGSPRKRYF